MGPPFIHSPGTEVACHQQKMKVSREFLIRELDGVSYLLVSPLGTVFALERPSLFANTPIRLCDLHFGAKVDAILAVAGRFIAPSVGDSPL